jgi:RimJ/RimL family protein N-acetyltransferase
LDTDIFRGRLVRLASLNRQDAGIIAGWSQDATYLRLLDTNSARPRTETEVAADLEKWAGASDTIVLGIRLLADDRLLGWVGFYEIEWSNQVAWLAVGIGDRTNWDHGYGSDALAVALRYAFNELNLHRVQLDVIETNARAVRVYEKCGFRREGAFREFGQRDGRRYDLILYGLLRQEWEAAQSRDQGTTPT